jgi:hypothetical protein
MTWIEKVFVLAIIIIIVAVSGNFISNYRARTRLSNSGYDMGDVSVFLDGVGMDAEQFEKSRGLRIQYELFRNGNNSEWVNTARGKKNADDARNESIAIGTAVGIGVGVGMSHGSK